MEEKLDKLQNSIEKVDKRLHVIEKHLAVYNNQLEVHIKRTELLEEDVKPIKKHVNQVDGIIKFLIVLSTISGLFVLFKK